MTFVVARKFGDRIVMLADTMIIDPNEPRPNIIPGQMKAIVLSRNVSVGYSGNLISALDAVRSCKSRLNGSEDLCIILDTLRGYKSCDFLVASHVNGPALVKVAGGQISAPQDVHWVGNPEIIAAMRFSAENTRESLDRTRKSNPKIKFEISEESEFINSFTSILMESCQISQDVGGFVMNLLASPYGHCYQDHAGVSVVGPFYLGGQPHPDEPSGGNRYGYNFLSGHYRGVGIAGIFMEEARVGYIYDPLTLDQPIKIGNTSLACFQDELKARLKVSDGVPENEIWKI